MIMNNKRGLRLSLREGRMDDYLSPSARYCFNFSQILLLHPHQLYRMKLDLYKRHLRSRTM